MLERISQLPDNVLGVRAKGLLTKKDYDQVLVPALEDATRNGRVRLLFVLGDEFRAMTPGGILADAAVGFRFTPQTERFAGVTDSVPLRAIMSAMALVVPFPMRIFRNSEEQRAVAWLTSSLEQEAVPHRLIEETGVLVIEPNGSLAQEDFDAFARIIDMWTDSHGVLDGVVIHTRDFPGWKDLGSFFAHVRFLRENHKKIRRIALVTDTPMAEFVPRLSKQIVHPEVKHFAYDAFDDAVAWAGNPNRAKTGQKQQQITVQASME